MKPNTNNLVKKINKNYNNKFKRKPRNLFVFSKNIINYLINKKSDKINYFKNFYVKQKEIKLNMRKVLLEWIINVNFKFRMSMKNLFLAINIIDSFLQKEFIPKSKFQLLGIASLYISSKYEQINPPNIKHFIILCNDMYTKDDLIDMESKILMALDFDLNKNIVFELLTNYKFLYNLSDQEYYLNIMIYWKNIYELSYFGVDPNEYTASIMIASLTTLNSNSLDNFSLIFKENKNINTIVSKIKDDLKIFKLHHESIIYKLFSKDEYGQVSNINFDYN